MAKQSGVLQIEGTVGTLTFYKNKDGYYVRQKTTPREITNDRVKENMQEFAKAAAAGGLVRKTFATIINDIKDGYLNRRLSQELALVIKSDKVNPRGFRKISDGNIELLNGFELNSDISLNSALKTPYSTEIDRATGVMKVEVPAFIPSKLITAPPAASHFKFTIAGAMVNFDTGEHLMALKAGTELLLSNEESPVVSLEVQLPVTGTAPLILALGLSFYQEVNGRYYSVGEGFYNALAFVAVSGS